jgi:hypothetical protein
MTYAYAIWEYAVLTPKNCIACRIEYSALLEILTVSELHVAFTIPYVHDYITNLCRKQAEVTLYHINPYEHGTGQGEGRHRKYMSLKFGGSEA